MDEKEMNRLFYRDGYRLASHHLEQGITALRITGGIAALLDSVDQLLGALLDRAEVEGRPAACRKGCSWCCHQAVFVVTHELLYLHQHVSQHFEPGIRSGILRKAEEKARRTSGLSLDEKLRFREPCPFLEKGTCLVYSARPMACRIYLSASAETCRRDYLDPGDEKQYPDLFEFPLKAGRMMNEGFVACLRQNGFSVTEETIEQGYWSVAATDLTMEEWIFKKQDSM